MNEPRCPIHHAEMIPAIHWIRLDGSPFPKPVRVCPVTDCVQAYGPEGHHLIPATEAVGNPIQEKMRELK